jgi:two-component system, NarL family, nitrate/nitrite sensor histidine kinase NarX
VSARFRTRAVAAHAQMKTESSESSSPNRAAGILRELASDLAAGDDLPELLKRFLEPLLRLTGARAGAVRVIDDAGDRMQLVSSVGLPASVTRAECWVQRECGACGMSAAQGIPVWVADMSACARSSGIDYFGAECRQMLTVALQHRGRVFGVYNLFFAQGLEPGPAEQAVLKSVGELMGLALNNARLEREQIRDAVMRERQSMAAEVHDSIAQTLAYVKLRMPLLQEAVRQHDESAALRYSADVRRAVSDAHAGLRELLTNFRAPVDPLGLRHALRSSIDEFRNSTGIELAFQDRAAGLELSNAQEAQLFRIVQEALTNIVKHADARHGWLTIDRRGDVVEILVEDDGHGVPAGEPDTRVSHYGIDIMRQRAARLGGRVEIGRRDGGGTCVRVCVPVSADTGATT